MSNNQKHYTFRTALGLYDKNVINERHLDIARIHDKNLRNLICGMSFCQAKTFMSGNIPEFKKDFIEKYGSIDNPSMIAVRFSVDK